MNDFYFAEIYLILQTQERNKIIVFDLKTFSREDRTFVFDLKTFSREDRITRTSLREIIIIKRRIFFS
jgi:hypothetical protein